MPEEKKKEKFTFSDKIKTGQQAGSKSFANRISSKIGLDGKPRQTLFERTKRDAPFFIAALVALLLLPFLYKYSGDVAEDSTMVTPGYEDDIANPNRSGFDFTDPEGQIAQLAGRDSMDLIVGFGKKGEEEAEEPLGDIYRSGLDDSSYARNASEEEVNTTNIYKTRKEAPVQTRAAFRRAATKINSLGRQGVSAARGGKLPTMWGGSMKSAASKVRGPGMRNSTKPVSLQPLVAAGKPTRSYFGQGAAAEAKRSKDAMSKANAAQALMDAQVKAVEPGRIGGLHGGDFGGPGGGLGNLPHNANFGGKEPWWWDLMKVRAQKEWERKFEYRWGWIDFGTKLLQTWLTGLLNCVVMGNSDGDPDTFIGLGEGSGKLPKCCGLKEKDFKIKYKSEYEAAGGDFETACKALKGGDTGKQICPSGWEAGHTTDVRLNGWQARWKCLGGKVKGAAGLEETSECRNMANKFYQVDPQGVARSQKWKTYIYVVARNYVPETVKVRMDPKAPRHYLCIEEDQLGIGQLKRNGVDAVGLNKKFDGKESGTERTKISSKNSSKDERNVVEDMYERDPEDPIHGCVIYMQKGDTFSYKNFKSEMIDRLRDLAQQQGSSDVEVDARNAFNQLDLMFVESFTARQKIAYGSNTVQLPLSYWRFVDAYIRHKGTAQDEGGSDSRRNVDKRKYRDYAKYEMGPKCFFDRQVSIDCEDGYGLGTAQPYSVATVTFKEGYKGQKGETSARSVPVVNVVGARGLPAGAKVNVPAHKGVADTSGIVVKATFIPVSLPKGVTAFQQEQTVDPQDNGNPRRYVFDDMIRAIYATAQNNEEAKKKADAAAEEMMKMEMFGRVRWNLYRHGEIVDTAECDFNMSGSQKGFTSELGDNEEVEEDVVEEVVIPEEQHEQNKIELPIQAESVNVVTPQRPDMRMPKETDRKKVEETTPEKKDPLVITLADSLENVIAKWHEKQLLVGENAQQQQRSGCSLEVPANKKEKLEKRKTYDQTAVKAYVDEVVAQANQKGNGDVILQGVQQVSVANLVDAMYVAQAMGKTNVPVNVVCALGKTIGLHARDPHVTASPNQFGAFAAYIDDNSSFFPYLKDLKGNFDGRFYGCISGKQRPPINAPFHYGRYNWNEGGFGDLNGKHSGRLGPMGRAPFESNLRNGGDTPHDQGRQWVVNGKFPLAAIAQAVGFTPSSAAKGSNKTIDSANRDVYWKKYDKIFNKVDSCGLTGDMNVADALAYVNLVCANGTDAKPSNGWTECSKEYAADSTNISSAADKADEDEE